MSRELPARPNLEHLKNQARDLLPALEQRDPEAKLADALHAVAREYGFGTWPQLKAHVESLNDSATALPVFAGRWTADMTKSKGHPLHPVRSATLLFDVDGDAVTISDVVVDAGGREERHTNALHADGTARTADNGYVVTAGWRHARALDVVVTKDGRIEGRVSYEVSADGTTMTVLTGEQVVVLNRVAAFEPAR
jgi:hypothetical protein